VSAAVPPTGEDERATRWTVSGGWRDGDKHFAGVALPRTADLPEMAVKWIEEDGLEPILMVAAWDYGLAARTHAELWRERRARRV
jgi:hypothetical protein